MNLLVFAIDRFLDCIDNFDYKKDHKFSTYFVKSVNFRLSRFKRKLMKRRRRELPPDNISQDGGRNGYTLADPRSPLADSKLESEGDKAIISELLHELPYRERDVLFKRYGLFDGMELNLREIGNSHGVSGERIRQVEKRAIKNVRESEVFREKFLGESK